jgi:TolB-like protein
MTRLASLTIALATTLGLPLGAVRAADPVGPVGPTPAPPVVKPDAQRPTVAILYFDYSGKDENLGVLKKGLAQMIITDLSGLTAVRIVERDRLQEIMDELKLGTSAKIDPATAAKVGKLLGARYMVMGGYFDLLGSLRVDARVVEVETGRIVRSVGSIGKGDDFLELERKVSVELEKILTSDAISALPPARTGQLDPTTPAVIKAPKPASDPAPAPARPKQLRTKTALKWARALDAIDRGNKEEATATLHEVVAEQPDFALAQGELTRLMR